MTDRSSQQRTRTRAVYVISVAAELAGMHPQTLRIYERRGLVLPARTQGGNRRYSDDDIEILRRIAELADQGLNLEGIKRVMALEAENARLRSELEERGRWRRTRAPRRSAVSAATWCRCARRSPSSANGPASSTATEPAGRTCATTAGGGRRTRGGKSTTRSIAHGRRMSAAGGRTGRGEHVDRSEPSGQPGGSGGGTERHRLALRCSQVVGRERGIRIAGEHEPQIELAGLPGGRDRGGGDLVDEVGQLGRAEHVVEAMQPGDLGGDRHARVLA